MRRAEILIVGSGAGGAMTAFELAAAGRDVCVLEEGGRVDRGDNKRGSLDDLQRFYRQRGMSPLLGKVPIGFVEGCCVGGGTEVNSGFWHRTPPDVLRDWRRNFGFSGADPEALEPHFSCVEELLGVKKHAGPWPKNTAIFSRGAAELGWDAIEVPRAALGAGSALIAPAEANGARVAGNCTVRRLVIEGDRVRGVIADLAREDGRTERLRIEADFVFVCCGAIQTPALLRKSGIKRNAGESLRVHPMLKVAALFDEDIGAEIGAIPLLQVKEFWPDITLGGAYFSPGHLAMLLGENWLENRTFMEQRQKMALFHVTVRGTGKGAVRAPLFERGAPLARYALSDRDRMLLSRGLARLCELLFAAGAKQVFPAIQGLPAIRSVKEAARWEEESLPGSALSLSTVHVFSSCPAGETERAAADSFGRVPGLKNLYLNDASMLPDSPGVNPQGTIFALARRNTRRFLENDR